MLMATAILLVANGCKDETPAPTNNNGGGGGTTTPEQYILMNGLKVKIKNPANGSMFTSQDTTLEWAGNKPANLNGDSVVIIKHPEGVKRGVSTISEIATDFGEVGIQIFYGATSAKTNLFVESGDYKLEKINGIWYSVLKNGAGEATKGSTTINLTGVEFRVAWPSTFK